jgi:hypothetical protein
MRSALEVGRDPVTVGREPHDAVRRERAARVGQQPNRLEHRVRHDGLNTLSWKLPCVPANPTRRVVAEDPRDHHRHRLGLGRVDLARHDRAARLVLRDHSSPMPLRGPDAYHRTSLAIFISAPARVRSDD